MSFSFSPNISVGDQNSYHGVYQGSNGNFYTILRGRGSDGDQSRISLHRATDPEGPWTEVHERVSSGSEVISSIATARIGPDQLFVAMQDMYGDTGVFNVDFVNEEIGTRAGLTNTIQSLAAVSIVNAGPITYIAAQGEEIRIMGTSYSQIYVYASSNNWNNWSPPAILFGEDEAFYSGVQLVKDPNSGNVFCLSMADYIIGRPGILATISGGDSSTPPAVTFPHEQSWEFSGLELYPIGRGVGVNRGGIGKIRFPVYTNSRYQQAIFDASADPSVATLFDINATPRRINSSLVGCHEADNEKIHSSWADNGVSDLYTSDDQGTDSWKEREKVLVGSLNHVSAAIVDGSQKVLGHIVNDNGIVKYLSFALAQPIWPKKAYDETYERSPEIYGKSRPSPKILNHYYWRAMQPTAAIRAQYLFNVWGPQPNNDLCIVGGVFGWMLEELAILAPFASMTCFEIGQWPLEVWQQSEEADLRQSILDIGENPDTLQIIVDHQGTKQLAMEYLLRPDNPLRTKANVIEYDVSDQNRFYNAFDRVISEDVLPALPQENVKAFLDGCAYCGKGQHPQYHIISTLMQGKPQDNRLRWLSLQDWYNEIAANGYPKDFVLEATTGNWITEGASGGPNDPFEPKSV